MWLTSIDVRCCEYAEEWTGHERNQHRLALYRQTTGLIVAMIGQPSRQSQVVECHVSRAPLFVASIETGVDMSTLQSLPIIVIEARHHMLEEAKQHRELCALVVRYAQHKHTSHAAPRPLGSS